jgi:hypothetical protein
LARGLRTRTSKSRGTCRYNQLEGYASGRRQSTRTVAAAARVNTGDRRKGDVLDYRANGWVVGLHRDDVVLARGLWWRGSARSELSTVRPKAATAALVGGEAPIEIGRQLRVVEHEQAMGKLGRGWIGAEEVWCWLSTGVPCVAGAEEDHGGGMWLGRSEIGTGTGGTGCRR